MSYPGYRRSFLSWFVPFLVLLLLACVMTLDLGGVTTALQHVQRDAYAAWSHVRDAAMPATPTPQALGDIRPEVWGGNAAALWPQLWLLFAAGLILLVLLGRRRIIAAFIVTLLIVSGAGGISWLLYAKAKVFFDTISPSAALALVWVSGALISSTVGARPRSRVTVVPVAAEETEVAEMARPAATGTKRHLVYLSCGIRQFPSLLDSFEDTAHAAPFVAHAMDEFRAVVNETGGAVVSASGDRFAAAWNATTEDAEAAGHACEAATRIMAAAAQIRLPGSSDPENTVAISAGIAGGAALAGTFADGAFAVAGECVDRAQMLRVLSAKYGPAILVGEEIRNAAEKGFAFVEVDCIAAENRAERIYALLGNPLVRASPKFRALSTFHEHLFQAIRERRWADARQLIGQCRNLSGAIPSLYDLQLARIEWYESHPPPDDWDGAFRPPVA
ncbi:MAG TPA: hypothetical protein VGG69_07815 [Rhizomicrobium sp.]